MKNSSYLYNIKKHKMKQLKNKWFTVAIVLIVVYTATKSIWW